MIRFRFCIFGSSDTMYLWHPFIPLLTMFTLITWLKWYLPGAPTLKSLLSPLWYQTFNLFIYLYLYGLIIFYFIQWVIIYHCHLVQCLNCLLFVHWKSIQVGFCVLWTCPHHSLNTSLLWGIKLFSRLILCFLCPIPGISHLSEFPWFL